MNKNQPIALWRAMQSLQEQVFLHDDDFWKEQEKLVRNIILQSLPKWPEVKSLGYQISPKVSEIERAIGYTQALQDVRKALGL